MTDSREQWTQELNARIGRSRRPAPLRNVVERVAAVLHGSELAFVDNALHKEDGVSGRIAVFTDTVVAVIDVAGVAPSFAHAPRSDQGTTTVVFLPRSALTRIALRQDPAAPYINSGDAWATQDAGRLAARRPPRAALRRHGHAPGAAKRRRGQLRGARPRTSRRPGEVAGAAWTR